MCLIAWKEPKKGTHIIFLSGGFLGSKRGSQTGHLGPQRVYFVFLLLALGVPHPESMKTRLFGDPDLQGQRKPNDKLVLGRRGHSAYTAKAGMLRLILLPSRWRRYCEIFRYSFSVEVIAAEGVWKLLPQSTRLTQELYSGSFFHPNPEVCQFYVLSLVRQKSPYQGNLILLTEGVKVLEIAVGAGSTENP